MSDATTINNELTRHSESLAMAVSQYDDACRDFAEKRTDYELARARALLRSTLKTAGAREAEATIACETVMRESRIAEGLRDALKERIRSLQSILNATQTRASFLKQEMRLAGRDY